MSLELKNINKNFGELEIFRDFSISFKKNDINYILGPSGCGKTSLLNIINGSVIPDSGNSDQISKLRVSYIFQEPRLLPWKTVAENISFVLKERMTKKEWIQRLDEYLNLIQLEKFKDYYPSKLSGGMKQRVAIARAFSYDSEIILMDEPFKALDYKLKSNLMEQFILLWEKDKRTVIFVTHDVDEALKTGGKIYLFGNPPLCSYEQFPIPEDREKKDKLRNSLIEKLKGNR